MPCAEGCDARLDPPIAIFSFSITVSSRERLPAFVTSPIAARIAARHMAFALQPG
jgi:hypothetical protein